MQFFRSDALKVFLQNSIKLTLKNFLLTSTTKLIMNNLSRLTLNHSKNFHHILSFSKLRHKPFVNFSDTFHHGLANTLTPSSSVFIASPVAAHTKKFICWINSEKFLSDFSSVPFSRNYHKCRSTLPFSDCIRVRKSINHNRKMVWITDLDDPKVEKIFRSSSYRMQASGKIHSFG